MKSNYFKIVISLLILAIICGFIYIANKTDNDDYGEIEFTLVDINGDEIKNDILKFTKEDTLITLLESNYTVRYAEDEYGVILYDVGEIETDFTHTYLAIYINDTYSSVGVSSISLIDGMKIKIVEMEI